MIGKYLLVLIAMLALPVCSYSQHAGNDTTAPAITKPDTIVALPLIEVEESRSRIKVVLTYKLGADGNPWRNSLIANNLSDYLAQNPSFSQITTGGNISKPVLHGMYGNRLLIMVNGLKYDAQQWQDEHGLGLSQIGVRSINTYNEPQSAAYGSEAIGGVIEIQDEQADSGKKGADATVRLHSNTSGMLADAGMRDGTHGILYNLRVGYETHADYADGDETRVLNSRSKGYYFKGGMGFNKKGWKQYNFYNFSYNQFGFIIPDLGTFFVADDRQSRAMSGPHHNVMLHVLNSQNDIALGNSRLQVNAGLQSNRRAEDEGGGQISLDIHLISYQENATWTRSILHKKFELQLRQNLLYQTNKNLGPRILIPDAHVFEANSSAKISYDSGRHVYAAITVGLNDRNIHTFATKYLNAPGKESQPFSVNRQAVNVTLLTSFHQVLIDSYNSPQYQVYNHISTGSRAANLAELSSDGLHEGSYQYEIGRSDLATEQNLSETFGVEFVSPEITSCRVIAKVSTYYNAFYNYIYLAPTTETKFGFPVFRYMQGDAHIAGGEVSYMVAYKPERLGGNSIRFQQAFSVTEGSLSGGASLPFIPPARLTTSLQYNFLEGSGRVSNAFISPQFVYTLAQNKPAQAETPTADYGLVNINTGATLAAKHTHYNFTLGIRNLLNKVYADHLSRIKYYGINNTGINVVLAVGIAAW